jgi:hypothetical protein
MWKRSKFPSQCFTFRCFKAGREKSTNQFEREWPFMTNELTNFLVSLRKLHTLYLYVNRPPYEDTELWHRSRKHNYDVRSQQVEILNAARSAIKLNPALQQLYVTHGLPPGNPMGNICRATEILVQSDDTVVENCWFVHKAGHIKECEMECRCGDEAWEWEDEKTFLGRHLLPMLN